MIQARHLKEIDHAAGCAAPRIGTAKNHAANADVEERAGAHRTRLFRHEEVAIVQSPVANRGFRLGNGEHLRMRSGVLEHLHLVEGAGNDPACAHDDRAYRHFFFCESFAGQAQGLVHESFVCRLIDQVVHVSKGLTNRGGGHTSIPRRVVELRCTMKTICALLALCLLPIAGNAATEQEIVNQSARILRQFRHMPERGIPRSVMRNAKGLAILTVVKIGFGLSGKGGQGVVVARTGNGWSGPSFLGTGGAGWGPQIGAQITEFVFVLNTNRAVRAFSRDGNFTLGADASVAAGPVGREAQAAVMPTAAIYTYSRTKGLFAGASLEGAVIATQKTANDRYYGRGVSARDILSGSVSAPPRASVLQSALER